MKGPPKTVLETSLEHHESTPTFAHSPAIAGVRKVYPNSKELSEEFDQEKRLNQSFTQGLEERRASVPKTRYGRIQSKVAQAWKGSRENSLESKPVSVLKS